MLKCLALVLLVTACSAPVSPDSSVAQAGGSVGVAHAGSSGAAEGGSAGETLSAGGAEEHAAGSAGAGPEVAGSAGAGMAGSPGDAGGAGLAEEAGAGGTPDMGSAGSAGSAGAPEAAGGAGPVPGSQWTHCDVIPGNACLDPLLCGQYIVHFGDSGENHVCTFTCRGANAGETSALEAKCKGIGGVCYSGGSQNAMCVPSEPTLAP